MEIQYTGLNYDEVRRFCGEKILAPYFCMGFSMLSLESANSYVTVNEGDWIVKGEDGSFSVRKG